LSNDVLVIKWFFLHFKDNPHIFDLSFD
jgi:hypothetical protein